MGGLIIGDGVSSFDMFNSVGLNRTGLNGGGLSVFTLACLAIILGLRLYDEHLLLLSYYILHI